MLKFVKASRQARASLYVVGNESADLDSCCSALVAAYLYSRAHQDDVVVPLIQIPRAELKLRKDIIWLFNKVGLSTDWLRFVDEETLSQNSQLFLVDHNKSTIPGRVIKIIDHHEPETQSLPKETVMKKTASCMSIVVSELGMCDFSLFKEDTALRDLCTAPIMMDSKNLTNPKTTELDKEIIDFLGGSDKSAFKQMSALKKDLVGLSPQEVLLKDYKQWGTIGISSLPCNMMEIKTQFPQFASAMAQMKTSRGLEKMVALSSGTIRGEYTRQLAIVGSLDPSLVPSLELVHSWEDGPVNVYDQRNTAASRKQVAPLLRNLFPATQQES